MFRSINKDIAVVADEETVVDIIVGVEAVSRRIVSATFEVHDSLDLIGYLDQDRVLEVSGACDSAAQAPIPLDLPLKIGQTFKAGVRDHTSGVGNANVTVVVEEK